MDDFGSHYSNLAVLIQYDFDSAKIDRSMVTEITNNRKSRILLDYMTSMINDLGIHCIVEGIETKEQVDILKKTKAEMIQGFYFGKLCQKKNFMKPLSQNSGAYHTNVRLLLTQMLRIRSADWGRKRKMEAVWHLGSDMLSFFRHIERDHCSVECPTA